MSEAGDKRKHDLRHVASAAPRVMVVDGSKLVRRLIGDVLHKELPNVEVVGCSGLEQARAALDRSEEHTSELQSLMRISYAVFCLKKKKHKQPQHNNALNKRTTEIVQYIIRITQT